MGSTDSGIRVLLGSGGISTESRRKVYRALSTAHFSGCEEVLFIPYASHGHSEYSARMRNLLGERAANLVGIETKADPVSAIESAEAIYVGGGNSFLLVRELHEMGLIEPIRKLVLSGAPYLGVSAGANVACPTVMTTNDMPIAHPESLDSLGVVPFQINPHYHPGKVLFMDGEGVSKHYGESRAQRISEFHKHRETPVLGMWEGSFVNWDGHRGRLTGRATAFRVGLEPKELTEGSVFDSGLMTIGHDE